MKQQHRRVNYLIKKSYVSMREVAKEGFVEACMTYPTLINK